MLITNQYSVFKYELQLVVLNPTMIHFHSIKNIKNAIITIFKNHSKLQ